MSQVEQTAEDVMDSVTGHDEMAIAQHFGQTVHELTKDPIMLGRALVFVTRRRQDGVNDDDARNFALDMSHKDLTENYFPDPAEASEGESEAAGKDVPDGILPPAFSLTSAP